MKKLSLVACHTSFVACNQKHGAKVRKKGRIAKRSLNLLLPFAPFRSLSLSKGGL